MPHSEVFRRERLGLQEPLKMSSQPLKQLKVRLTTSEFIRADVVVVYTGNDIVQQGAFGPRLPTISGPSFLTKPYIFFHYGKPSPTSPSVARGRQMTTLTMSYPIASNATSLDRLKALDLLPDSKSAIAEATKYCNHEARAEMILRWLITTKFKQSTSVGLLAEAWDLLALAVRLLPPQKIAALLGPINFYDVITSLLPDPGFTRSTMVAIQQFLELLLSLGKGPDGASVRAVISAEAARVSVFCGAWFSSVLDRSMGALTDLDVALELWALRKKASSDGTMFTRNCLVPVLGLLAKIEADGSLTSSKRSRDDNIRGDSMYHQRSLRSLLASHSILPARAAVKTARNTIPATLIDENRETEISALDELLRPLKVLTTKPQSQTTLPNIPVLLEIAFLSVPTPSPRHRDRERPWLEQFFTCLLDCVFSADLPYNVCIGIATDLLEIIRQYGSLSSQKLLEVVRTYALPSTDTENQIDWKLVTKLIEIDANVFTDGLIAELLFDAVSKATTQAQATPEITTSLKDLVVQPVMIAFAQARKLSVFVTLWQKQLVRSEDYLQDNVWVQLSGCFADLVETSFSHEQSLDLFTTLQAPIVSFLSSSGDEGADQQNANLVLLRALLGGVRSEELLDKIHDKLQPLLRILFQVAELKVQGRLIKPGTSFWRCLEDLFTLWFPLWAIKESSPEVVETEMDRLVTNQAFKSALSILSEATANKPHLTQNHDLIQAAGLYVATVCDIACNFSEQGDIRSACTTAGKSISSVPHLQALQVYTQYPRLLADLSKARRGKFLLNTFTNRRQRGLKDHDSAIKSIILSTDPVVMEQSIDVLVQSLEVTSSYDGNLNRSFDDLMLAFINIPPEKLTEDQVSIVMTKLIGSTTAVRESWSSTRFHNYLQMILHILHRSRPADFVNLTQLWEFAEAVDSGVNKALVDSAENQRVFEVVVKGVVSSWLVHRDDPKASEATQLLLKHATKHIGKKNSAAKPGMSTIARILVEKLSDGHCKLVAQGVSQEFAEASLKDQLSEASRAISQLSNSEESSPARWINLNLILEAAKSFSSGTSPAIVECRKRLAELCVDIVNKFTSAHTCPEQTRTLVCCFVLACELGQEKEVALVPAAVNLLGLVLNPLEQSESLSAYSKMISKSTAKIRHMVLSELLRLEGLASSASLKLWQAVIAELAKEDFEDAEGVHSSLPLLQTLEITKTSEKIPVVLCALRTTNLILRKKTFMVNQHGIERTISTLQHLSTRPSHIAVLYPEISRCVTLILTQHRSRVQDRLHLIVTLLQSLLSPFFRPSKIAANPKTKLSARHATAFARLLIILCNRRPGNRNRGRSSELVDDARKLQARTGQYVQFILHHYCTLVLSGAPAAGVREALVPGLWAVIEAIEVNGAEGIKALSAAMSNNERAVLKSVYDDWKRFGKWEGL